MDSARDFRSPQVSAALPYSVERHGAPSRRPEVVVLQVDDTVSSIDGFAWLRRRRDSGTAERLGTLEREALAQGWSWPELTRARLRLFRPRRAEINELGAAYLDALTPGAAEAALALRRSGVSVVLASDVAAESLFGLATALGASPDELYAPRLRFDALGAYVSCDLSTMHAGDAGAAGGWQASGHSGRILYVGARRSPMFAPRGIDSFVAFSGVVAREEGAGAGASVSSFHDLTALVLR